MPAREMSAKQVEKRVGERESLSYPQTASRSGFCGPERQADDAPVLDCDQEGITVIAESEAAQHGEISELQVAAMWTDLRALAERGRARSHRHIASLLGQASEGLSEFPSVGSESELKNVPCLGLLEAKEAPNGKTQASVLSERSRVHGG